MATKWTEPNLEDTCASCGQTFGKHTGYKCNHKPFGSWITKKTKQKSKRKLLLLTRPHD